MRNSKHLTDKNVGSLYIRGTREAGGLSRANRESSPNNSAQRRDRTSSSSLAGTLSKNMDKQLAKYKRILYSPTSAKSVHMSSLGNRSGTTLKHSRNIIGGGDVAFSGEEEMSFLSCGK